MENREQAFADAIIDNLPGLFFVLDSRWRLVRWNRAAAEITGLAAAEPPGTDGPLPIVEEDRQRVADMLREAFEIGHAEVEARVLTKAGGRDFLLTGTRMDIGQDRYLVGSGIEVTDRKRGEEALRESEERCRLFMETVPQLAWRASHGGLNVECNRRWYEYTGQTRAQVGYHGWLAAVHTDDLARVAERILHASIKGEAYELEYRLRRGSDGAYRWHLSRAVPVRDQQGQIVSWFGCATDIEDLKKAQEIQEQARAEELKTHRTELAHVARVSLLGEMAAGLAHELNQPLHVIKTYAQGSVWRLSKARRPDQELVSALEQISNEADRAAAIIRRIRQFVQKREVGSGESALNNLVEEVVLLCKPEIEHHRVRVALELSAGLPLVLGDPIQIEQVLVNLVRNGIEAMDEVADDDRLLTIQTRPPHREMVQVEVRDCGKGICPEDRERVFQPFFTTKPEGMGMGLVISRSIIQGYRGRLWLAANEDRGCTFCFTLPTGKKT